MAEQLPPDWAIDKAANLARQEPGTEEYDDGYSVEIIKRTRNGFPTTLAFARYIASKEEAPVDPALKAARELLANDHESGAFQFFHEGTLYKMGAASDLIMAGHCDLDPQLGRYLLGIARGIEIGKAQA